LYQLAAGEKPFTGANTMAVLKAVALKDPEPIEEFNSEVPEPLAELIMQLLEKNPDDRPQSSREVAERLVRVAEEPDVTLAIPGTRLKPRTRSRIASAKKAKQGRSRMPIFAGVMLIGLVALGAILSKPLWAPSGPIGPGTKAQVNRATAQG